MFGVKHNECVGFESKWKVVKVTSESSSQSSEFSVQTKETSTNSTNTIEIQTDDPEIACAKDVDMKKLAEWLNKIYPNVSKEINDANNCTAFRGYSLMDESKDFTCKLVQVVNSDIKTKGAGESHPGIISALSWNSTGKYLGVAKTHKHKNWCHHVGSVSIYVYRGNKLIDNPKKKLTCESCVNDIKFHPTFPAVVAAGTYTGAINIWNINQDEENMLILNINGHDENITQLSWVPNIDSIKTFLLASSSIDGFLKLWTFDITSSLLANKSNYRIKVPLFGQTTRVAPVPDEISKKIWRGIVAFDFSKFVHDMFVVGLEGGLVVQCSISGATDLKGSTTEKPLMDPVFKYYEPHDGEVLSVTFSPNRKEMFMTCGTDADIRIYILGQDDPAQVLYTVDVITCITWIPFEEKLVAGCGPGGTLEIFQVQKGKRIENLIKDKVSLNVLTKIAINSDNYNIIVLGSVNGDLQLWNIPWRLISNINQ